LQRLLEIVIRHARYNRYQFVVTPSQAVGEFDIALVDMTASGGSEVADTLRQSPVSPAVITVGRRNDPTRRCDDLLQQNFSIDVLRTLNRVVEGMLSDGDRADATPASAHASVGLPRMPLARRPRALIIDPSPAVRRQVALALQQMGMDSEGVGSGREADDLLRQRRYEVALLEVTLPDCDGFRLIRRIKRAATSRAMPVVILSLRSSPLDLMRGAIAGADGYLAKPVSLQSLRETLLRQLRKSIRLAAVKPLVPVS
jgi:CheY-like chemotaxis protein